MAARLVGSLSVISVLVAMAACGASGSEGGGGSGDGDAAAAPAPTGTVAPTPGEPGDDSGTPAEGDASKPDAATGDGGADPTLNTGDTSGKQAAARAPGSACSKDDDCDSSGGEEDQAPICLLAGEGFPGGYCSFLTDNGTSTNYGCNAFNGKHVPLNAGFGDGYCAHICADSRDCRVGYRCVSASCQPDCARPDYTCWMGQCSATKKVCGP